MKALDHPNILPVIGVCLESNDESGLPFMVLPFMVNGDLKSYLKNKRISGRCVDQFPEVHILKMLTIICVHVYVSECMYNTSTLICTCCKQINNIK